MSCPINVLLVTDQVEDALCIETELADAGFQVSSLRVETARKFLAHLNPPPDLIISGDQLAQFSGAEAFQLLQSLNLEIPFILFADPIGEEQTALAIKQGVDDFVLRQNPSRLGPAVRRALEEHRQRREERQKQEIESEIGERFRLCIEEMPAGLAMFTAVRGADEAVEDFRIVYLNREGRSETRFWGRLTPGALLLESSAEFRRSGLYEAFRRTVETGKLVEREWMVPEQPGMVQAIEAAYDIRVSRMGDGLVVIWRDITEAKRIQQELRRLSVQDALTGLFNRSYFEAEMKRLRSSRLYPISILVAHAGLDRAGGRFRPGDEETLRRVGRLLVSCFRREDVVARLGGDQFAVILPKTGAEAARRVLQRVRDAERCQLLNLSLGMATVEKGEDLAEAFSRAEQDALQDVLTGSQLPAD